ncbi:MAG: peptide deformylase [Proteobacteria bacterium]|nr:peptide deformylase [Pseudomonadota bacterium]MDA0942040.1 peptide deformylase [Pseudomonadota bacterium]MDA1034811.1 peptide deformylase [Pseudomonadota bacterium]
MALLNILKYPDPRLHKVADPVTHFNGELASLITNMAETMYEFNGIGLAATQVDIHKRIIVIDISEEKNSLITLINPILKTYSGHQEYDEGCLSVPSFFETVKRYELVSIDYQDEHGQTRSLTADGLLSVCIQHEMDHLVGKVFVEKLSQLKQQRIKKKITKLLRSG